jgi:hypothetical protein
MQSQAYVLYRLGLNAKALMKGYNVPDLAELEKQLAETGRHLRRCDRRKPV